MVNQSAAEAFHAKARESLASAENDFAAGRYNSCVNRAYFACHQAAKGALLAAGIAVDGHKAVQARFSGDLINRRKVMPAEVRDTLSRLITARHQADYATEPIGAVEATRLLRRAQTFLAIVVGT